MSSALAGGFFTTKPPGKPRCYVLKYLSTCKKGSIDQACIATPLPPGELGSAGMPSFCVLCHCHHGPLKERTHSLFVYRYKLWCVWSICLHGNLGHVVSSRTSACGCLWSCSCWPGRTPQPSSFQLLGFPHPGRRQREEHLEARLSDTDLSMIHKDFPYKEPWECDSHVPSWDAPQLPGTHCLPKLHILFFLIIYLFIWLYQVLVEACRIF